MSDIEHVHTDEIVCPWCGYEHGDSWEWEDEGTVECDGCDKPFSHLRDYTITYVTEKEQP